MDQVTQSAVGWTRIGDHVALVTLNRPTAHNAVSRALAAELAAIVDQTEADPAVRAVVLTGAGGRAFCTGADLKETADGGMRGLFIDGKGFGGFVNARRSKPWIAAVEGYALAGGCEIALACDMIVAAAHAQFGLPEVARGLIAAAGGIYRLGRRIPKNVAIELLVTGRMMGADEAHRLGLVNRVTAQGEAVSIATALANEIAGNAPLAVRETLALFRDAGGSEQSSSTENFAALERLMSSADFAEGVNAFVEKRAARWSGR